MMRENTMRLVMLAAILSALAMPAFAQSSHGGSVWSYFGFGGSGPHFGDGDRDGGRHFSDDHGGRGEHFWIWGGKGHPVFPAPPAPFRGRPAALGVGLF